MLPCGFGFTVFAIVLGIIHVPRSYAGIREFKQSRCSCGAPHAGCRQLVSVESTAGTVQPVRCSADILCVHHTFQEYCSGYKNLYTYKCSNCEEKYEIYDGEAKECILFLCDYDTEAQGGHLSLRITVFEWGLQQFDLQKIDPLPLNPAVRASLISSHSQGLNTQEIQAQLSKETNTHVCCHTVKHYLKILNLKLLLNDVESGKISLEKVYKA
ncbi:hypothetical protein VP01_5601g1, partial [Puccinia sorghi]